MNQASALKNRKIRSDKKRDVKPTVSIELKETVARLAFITNSPVKDVAEQICINGFNQRKVIEHLAKKFKRDIKMLNTIYLGNPSISEERNPNNLTVRLSIRFSAGMHDNLSVLAYALDCSVSRACALLLDAGLRDTEFINAFVKTYLEENLDRERMDELKNVLKYINAANPYNEEFSWASLLSYMIDEIKETTTNVQKTVSDFIVHHWRS